jgi:peroxiredoxin
MSRPARSAGHRCRGEHNSLARRDEAGVMSRRMTLVFLATGIAAAGFGVAVNWWRSGPAGVAADATAAFFDATFPDADGTLQPLAQWRGRPLVVNFWATWCPPCVEEMPDLQKVRDDYRGHGVEVIGLGIDSAAKIAAFREQHRISLPLLVAAADGSELGRTLGNGSGALPFTVLIGADGRIRERHLGQVRPEQLRRWIDRALAER